MRKNIGFIINFRNHPIRSTAINEAYQLQISLRLSVTGKCSLCCELCCKRDVLKFYMDGVLRHPDLEYPIDVYCFELLSNVL